jgi:hypothetical protein
MIRAWNWFFHARAGPKACVIAGWARIVYALLILADKGLLTVDFHWFFLSGRMVRALRIRHSWNGFGLHNTGLTYTTLTVCAFLLPSYFDLRYSLAVRINVQRSGTPGSLYRPLFGARIAMALLVDAHFDHAVCLSVAAGRHAPVATDPHPRLHVDLLPSQQPHLGR